MTNAGEFSLPFVDERERASAIHIWRPFLIPEIQDGI
jgi:hypothetical protein